MFAKGFVFGKFYPLHRGHLAMMRYAASLCQQLTVVVCSSNRETISASIRAGWIKTELATEAGISLIEFCYDESVLPNTSVSDRQVSQVWAQEFKQLLPEVDLLVTSEIYGDYVAEYMGIQHIKFDPARRRTPISASNIREDILNHWQYLPDSVKRYFQKVVVISGTESTGKTDLAKYLASAFDSVLVEETARDVIADSKGFALEDLYAVAQGHAGAIQSAKATLVPLVIVDTDIYTTQSYADFVFGKPLNLPAQVYEINRADLRLFLDASVPHVQDGTRLDEIERNQLDARHRQTLHAFAQTYQEISGPNWENRTRQSHELITGLFGFNISPHLT